MTAPTPRTPAEQPEAAGVEMDVYVLKTLFGVKKVYDMDGKPWTGNYAAYYIPSGKPWRTHHIDAVPVPSFSTDYGDAMRLFERAVEATGSGALSADMEDARGEGFVVSVALGVDGAGAVGPFPLAVCHAALVALEAARRHASAADRGGEA